MANLILATVSIYLLAFNSFLAVIEASRRVHEKSYSPSKKASPTPAPIWFRSFSGAKTSNAWNMYGQWFNQITSKPSGDYLLLREIRESKDFWELLSAERLEKIKRADFSIFRSGLEPNFTEFINHKTAYILSYKLRYGMLPSTSPRGKLSRNQAMKLKAAGKLDEDVKPFPHYHVFDSLIDAALNSEESKESESGEGKMPSSEPVCNIDTLTSEIMGFLFKFQYRDTFIQVFLEGTNCPEARKAEEEIESFLTAALPGLELGKPRWYRLAPYSQKIVLGSPSSLSSRSRSYSMSPKKTPSHTVTIDPSSDEGEDVEDIEEIIEEIEDDQDDEEVESTEESVALAIDTSEEALESPGLKVCKSADSINNLIESSPYSDDEEDRDLSDTFGSSVDADFDFDNVVSRSHESACKSATLDDIIDDGPQITLNNEEEGVEDDADTKDIDTFNNTVPQNIPALILISELSIEERLFERILSEKLDFSAARSRQLHEYFERIRAELNR